MTTSRAGAGAGTGNKAAPKLKPQIFGRYLLLDRVASGGMAEVWRAKIFGADDFQRIIAIKKILPHVCEDQEFIQMFKDEAKITVQLQHANIGQVYELGKIDDTFFIAMEYISGKDAKTIWSFQRQRGEPLPVPLACFLIQKMCEGLDYAHRKRDNFGVDLKIVHRDVSPQNVLISWEGEVKVIDFGIAKAAGKASKTQAGILKGKFGYMAPEQVRGMPIDQRADVFALGVCLYEMVTGERAFVADSDFSLLEMVRNVEIKPPTLANNKVPPEVERIIYKALAKDPDDRYQWGSDLGEDLQRFMLMNGRAPSRNDLAEYLRQNFTVDYDKERLRMESYRDIEMPEQPKPRAADDPFANVNVGAPAAPAELDSSSSAVMAALAEDGASAPPPMPTPPPQAAPTAPRIPTAPAASNTGIRAAPGGRESIRPAAPMAPAAIPVAMPPPPAEPAEKGGLGKIALIALAVVLGIVGIAAGVGLFLRGSGTITISTSPPGAEVFLDGKLAGNTSQGDLVLQGVPVGPRIIKVTKQGYVPVTQSVNVARNQVAEAAIALPVPTALWSVKSKPGGAAIWLDGADTGKVTPADLELPVGNHTVELRLPNHRNTEKKISVEADKKQDLDVPLNATRVNYEIRSIPSGAKIFDVGNQQLGVTPWIYKDLSVDPPFPKVVLKYPRCADYDVTIAPDDREGVEQSRSFEMKCK
ncbi:MAG: serine/threonine-protein kinase [Myxococcota bacterium]